MREQGLPLQLFLPGERSSEKNPVTAHRWLYLSAEQGNPVAQYEMGNAYYKGDHVPLDLAAALHWVKKAAEQNLPGCSK